jgi:hypothetical protein
MDTKPGYDNQRLLPEWFPLRNGKAKRPVFLQAAGKDYFSSPQSGKMTPRMNKGFSVQKADCPLTNSMIVFVLQNPTAPYPPAPGKG